MQAVIVFLKLNFDLINIIFKKFWSGISCAATKFAQKTSSNIVFLKLDFDLPHIICRNLVGNFVQSRPENDVFLKLDQDFSYVISDTNEREVKK